MPLKCFTIITHEDGYYDILKQSCKRHKLNLDVIGYGLKYKSHLYKTYKSIEYLKLQKPDDIILFIDGFDSIVLEDADIIENKFKDMKLPFIFSEDLNYTFKKKCLLNLFLTFNYTNNFIFNNLMRNARPCKQDNIVKYINSGLYIGYARQLLNLFNFSIYFISPHNNTSNQRVLQDMCNKNIKINTDKDKILFNNFTNRDKVELMNDKVKINNKFSCIISKPGLGNLDKIAKYLNYNLTKIKKRNVIKYYYNGPNKSVFILYCLLLICILLYFTHIILLKVNNTKNFYWK